VLQACSLADDDHSRRRASWWLKNISITTSTGSEGRHELVAVPTEQEVGGERHYMAKSTGHFFWRSSWEKDALLCAVAAGPNHQAHDADDQGAIYLYMDRWILAPQNINSHSGILQAPQYQNTMVFEEG